MIHVKRPIDKNKKSFLARGRNKKEHGIKTSSPLNIKPIGFVAQRKPWLIGGIVFVLILALVLFVSTSVGNAFVSTFSGPADYQMSSRMDWSLGQTNPVPISQVLPVAAIVTEENMENIAREFLRQRKQDLGISSLGDLRLARIGLSPSMKGKHKTGIVSFTQEYQGLPIFRSKISVLFQGDFIVGVVGKVEPIIKLQPTQPLSHPELLDQAHFYLLDQQYVGDMLNPTVTPLIYPLDGTYFRAFKFDYEIMDQFVGLNFLEDDQEFSLSQPTLIIGEDGQVFELLENLNAASGRVTGVVFPGSPYEGSAEVPFANEIVNANSETSTNANGEYSVAGNSVSSALRSRRLEVRNEAQDSASYSATGDGVDWNWGEVDTSHSHEDVHEESNVYYHIDQIQSYFDQGEYPFDIVPTPFPMPVRVQVRGGCNAFAGLDGLGFFGGAGSCLASSLDPTVVLHEFSHRIVHYFYDNLPYYQMHGAMNEGFADYFAGSMLNDERHGFFSSGDEGNPARSLSNNQNYPNDMYFGTGDRGGVHHNANIFSGVLWDIRRSLGQETMDELALRAMELNGHVDMDEITFFSFCSGLLQADDLIYGNAHLNDGTPHLNAICTGCDNHGVASSFCNVCPAGEADDDGDGRGNSCDNCVNVQNEDQLDNDGDGVGNACDPCSKYDPDQLDSDGDGVNDVCDLCPAHVNPLQDDLDRDTIGDACDDDIDGDGILNTADNCPLVRNSAQQDNDEDNIGDLCDSDRDNDGIDNYFDNCPSVFNIDQADQNLDGVGDACESCQDVFSHGYDYFNQMRTSNSPWSLISKSGHIFATGNFREGGANLYKLRPDLSSYDLVRGGAGIYVHSFDIGSNSLVYALSYDSTEGVQYVEIFTLAGELVQRFRLNFNVPEPYTLIVDDNLNVHIKSVRGIKVLSLNLISGEYDLVNEIEMPDYRNFVVNSDGRIHISLPRSTIFHTLSSTGELLWEVDLKEDIPSATWIKKIKVEQGKLLVLYSISAIDSLEPFGGIAIYDFRGNFLSVFGGPGVDAMQFSPRAATILQDGSFIIANAADSTIYLYRLSLAEDADLDGIANSCDSDADDDGLVDIFDNCPFIKNGDQTDSDRDGIGDVCDNCNYYNPNQLDTDADGIGDLCDNCPLVANTLGTGDLEIVQIGVGAARPVNSPKTAGNYVIWHDSGRLKYYNIDTKIANYVSGAEVTASSVSDVGVGWVSGESNGPQVYWRDFEHGITSQITSFESQKNWVEISDNKVVWSDRRSDEGDIYLHDLSTGQEVAIVSATGEQMRPDIFGNTVVWQDNRGGGRGNWDLYGYDISNENDFRLTWGATGFGPSIYAENVVYTDRRNILLKFLSHGLNKQITTEGGRWVTIYGDLIVWEDDRNGNKDIYSYNLKTGEERQITSHLTDETSPAISNRAIVWEDMSSGISEIHGIISQYDSDFDGLGNACDARPNAFDDLDGDGIGDGLDNCPNVANIDQLDTDLDSFGDACDLCPEENGWAQGCPDDDNDGVMNLLDNCPLISNRDQLDTDLDSLGDVCDLCPTQSGIIQGCPDDDNDGVHNLVDNCPSITNTNQLDKDGDSVGNPCDNCDRYPNTNQIDSDQDGIGDVCDNCWYTSNPDQIDSNLDCRILPFSTNPECGDACSLDEDRDGVKDVLDNCPNLPNPSQIDMDGDGFGNECDSCPFVAGTYDGCTNLKDTDGDNTPDQEDNCPTKYNPDQSDIDGDGFGDRCDPCVKVAGSYDGCRSSPISTQ